MARTPTLLLIGRDPALKAELEAALAGAGEARVALHSAADLAGAVEAARARDPQLVCADLGPDARALGQLAQELAAVAPAARLVALYERAALGAAADAESAFLLQAVQAGVRDFLRRPLAGAELRGVLERVQTAFAPAARAQRAHVVAFASNKGGVGKSTLAVNTACALALRHPGEVLLIDASLQLGVCASLLDLQPETTIVDAVRERGRLDARLLRELCAAHRCGLRLLAAPADAVDAQGVDEEAFTQLVTLARRSFRFIVIDTFPLLDALVVSALDLADRMYVVLSGTVPDVLGTARYLEVLARLGLPAERRRVVLNRCGAPHAGRLALADVEERLGAAVDHELPYRRGVLAAQNSGEPYVLRGASRFGYRRAHRLLVDEIETESSGSQA